MEGVRIDFPKLLRGATKWVIAAIGIVIAEGIVAFLARDLIGTYTGLAVLSFYFAIGFLSFAGFLGLILEPLEWLGRSREPDGPTLERRLEQVRNAFLFDVFEIVMGASAPTIGAKLQEFKEAHPGPSDEEQRRFQEQLRSDASKGLIEPLDEEAVVDLDFAMDLIDMTRALQSIAKLAHRQLRRFVYASAAYYPGAVLIAAFTAQLPFAVEGVGLVLYFSSIVWVLYVGVGFGPQYRKLRWWRTSLERLKDMDSVRMKREMEELEPPKFPLERHP